MTKTSKSNVDMEVDISKDDAIKSKKEMDKKRKEEVKRRMNVEAMKEIRPLALGSFAMLCSSASNQAVPRLLGKILDQASSSATPSTSSTCPAMDTAVPNSTLRSLAFVVLGGGLASFLRTTMLNRAQDNIASRLRSETFQKLLTEREFEWFQMASSNNTEDNGADTNETSADTKSNATKASSSSTPSKTTSSSSPNIQSSPAAIGTILTNDIQKLSESLTTTLANTIRSTSSCLFATTHMMSLNPNLLGLAVSIVPVIGAAAVVLNKFVKKVTQRQAEITTQAATFAEERLSHIGTVKMSSREEDEVSRYAELQRISVDLGRAASVAKGTFMGFMFAASSGALFLVFHAGGKAVSCGKMTNGELTSFATYTFMLGLGTSGIVKAMGEYVQGLVCAERVYALIDGFKSDAGSKDEEGKDVVLVAADADRSTSGNASVQHDTINAISVNKLDFSYASDPSAMILKSIDLTMKRGQVVALVGKNGSGKSTLASLLVALYKPQGGRVYATSDGDDGDEIDLYSLDRKTQSQLVQLVPQHPALFDMSILENVTYTNKNATEEEVKKALTTANCDGFISKMKEGLDYSVGRNGCKLSGGQRQRLALARALLSDPCLLILDEPTSSLDVEGENAVADAVRTCRDGDENGTKRGLLLITHRMASLQMADLIVVLKDGQIVEQGTYLELKNEGSELCELMPDLL